MMYISILRFWFSHYFGTSPTLRRLEFRAAFQNKIKAGKRKAGPSSNFSLNNTRAVIENYVRFGTLPCAQCTSVAMNLGRKQDKTALLQRKL